MTLAPGTRLGRYEIRGLLGSGGMGEVYRARDADLERDIAVKILREGSDDSGDRLRRFVQEAKAASGLHHPNVAHVYEIGLQDNLRFIAMELVEGETLRERIGRGAMPIEDVLSLGTQIAAAIGAAHKMDIVHRDIKPENVIITPDGYAKVLDFGLAKLREMRADDAATLLKTSRGVTLGTIAYMAPEQLVGGDVHPAADVFSLGVVLYEMLTGSRPFQGDTTTDVVSAILSKSPRPLLDVRADIPPKLAAIVGKALAKDVDERYREANELAEQLRLISREGVVIEVPRKRRNLAPIAAVLAGIIVLVAIVWKWNDTKRRRQAVSMISAAERLIGERRLADAYDTAASAASMLPNDDRIRDILSRTSSRLTVDSDPTGATVYVQRFKGPDTRVRLGTTPLVVPRIALADYLMTVEKPGYATVVRSLSTTPFENRGEFLARPASVHVKLAPSAAAPADMVLVEGGTHRLGGFERPTDRSVDLHDFFVDRFEVSNAEFEKFVRAGGYRRRELWKYPFVDQGKTLTFEQAMARMHDQTGLPAPRGWSGGAPPAAKENHPVTDVTWYEAAAFAEWSGKKLPTVYQWDKAARYANDSVVRVLPWSFLDDASDVNERANFRGEGTMPVDSLPFGASPYGALNMAGNVSEWCRNPFPPGFAARGGSWKDAVYAFGQTAAFPGFYSAPTLGFRCVRDSGGEEGSFALNRSDAIPVYKPVDDNTYRELAQRFDYKPEPLDATVVERVETSDWTREKIRYTSAGKTVPAYIWLPKGFRRPLQAIQYAPAGDVVNGQRTLPHSVEMWLGPTIRSGRAVFSVELEGFLGRPHPPNWVLPPRDSAEFVDSVVQNVTEMRRGLDYLHTRRDIDSSRIGFCAFSAGGGPGMFVTALETRYRALMFVGTGLTRRDVQSAPAANRINFVPHINGPKFLLDGKYDEDTPLQSDTMPMFRLLREPKRLQVYDGPHVPPAEVQVPALKKWFDETMGPVVQ